LKLINPNNPIPTHVISGFLGAGKTTLLLNLLQQKPENEKWAVLMNEFGQIGIDQKLLPQTDDYAVQELLGGCLCCSSQLPMQITLSRLISDQKIDRLFIEPTGLGHPSQLLEQLTEPHWHQHLSIRSPITVVDGSRLHDSEWTQQNLYNDQLKAAQIIVVSHTNSMSEHDHSALQMLKEEYSAYSQKWLMAEQGNIQLKELDAPYIGTKRLIQPLLKIQKTLANAEPEPIKQLPYHYVESAQGYSVAGWKMPKRWQFNFYDLLDLLCDQKEWLRIKAVFNTDLGWKSFNFNPEQFNYQSAQEGIDNRLEIIYQNEREWLEFEEALFNCKLN
jgi:G3E family GTPase